MGYEKEIDELFFTRKIEKNKKNKGIYIPLRRGYGLRNLISAANKAPQVMVKIPRRLGSSNGTKGIKNHLDYISRNGKLDIEDQDGNIYQGKNEIQDILQNLNNLTIPKNSNRREAINFVFSMPPGTNPSKVKNAVRNLAQEQFKNHQYYFTLHTDTDHPHVHLCFIIEGKNGRKYINKADLMEYRIRFADYLREQGIECTATYKVHQSQERIYQHSTIEHIKKRGGISHIEKIKKSPQNYLQQHNPLQEKTKRTLNIIQQKYEKIFNICFQNQLHDEAEKISILIENFNSNYEKLYKNETEKSQINNEISKINYYKDKNNDIDNDIDLDI